MNRTLLLLMLVICETALGGQVVDVFFLAGQSNASGRVFTGYTSDPRDALVDYYYRTDGPPATDVTSGGEFVPLAPLASGYYGPEIQIGRSLVDLNYNPAIIKVSDGASPLATDWNSQTPGPLWSHWVSDVTDALGDIITRGDQVRLQGFFWMQGENDALVQSYADAYETNFNNLLDDITTTLSNVGFDSSNLRFVTGLILDRTNATSNPWPYSVTVRDAQKNVMDSRLRSDWFETNDIPNTDGHYGLPDDPSGVYTLGQRFVDNFHSGATAIPEPSACVLVSVVVGIFILRSRRRAMPSATA